MCVDQVAPLGAGWSKLEEVRRQIDYFRQSGKWTAAYMNLVRYAMAARRLMYHFLCHNKLNTIRSFPVAYIGSQLLK